MGQSTRPEIVNQQLRVVDGASRRILLIPLSQLSEVSIRDVHPGAPELGLFAVSVGILAMSGGWLPRIEALYGLLGTDGVPLLAVALLALAFGIYQNRRAISASIDVRSPGGVRCIFTGRRADVAAEAARLSAAIAAAARAHD